MMSLDIIGCTSCKQFKRLLKKHMNAEKLLFLFIAQLSAIFKKLLLITYFSFQYLYLFICVHFIIAYTTSFGYAQFYLGGVYVAS